MHHRLSLVLLLLLTLAALAPAAAQPSPTITASWAGRVAVVTWEGAPAQACVHRHRANWPEVVLPGACGAAGQVELPPGGDVQYVPRVGDVYTLRDERTGLDVAAVELGPHVVILPVVVGR